jgi:hypothetical protein
MEHHRLRYDVSRYRYLKVRVHPDRGKSGDKPQITSVAVYHTVDMPGQYVTLPASIGAREAVRTHQGPGSAWIIELGGRMVPCEKLAFDVADEDFARPFALEEIQDDGGRRVVTRGEWRRRAGSSRTAMEMEFGELVTHRLRLTVTDHRNPPLTITGVRYTAPIRPVTIGRSKDLAGPLKLYVNNPKAQPPHYDFAANLPEVLKPSPTRTELGDRRPNPVYQPEPKPWTERWPWLVYVVLGTSSLVLLGILGVLARTAVVRHDAAGQDSM